MFVCVDYTLVCIPFCMHSVARMVDLSRVAGKTTVYPSICGYFIFGSHVGLYQEMRLQRAVCSQSV